MKYVSVICILIAGMVRAAEPNDPVSPSDFPHPVRVACVGDSITAGVGTAIRTLESYPAQLQRMLGERWEVGNFGNSGSTLLNSGDKPYQKQGSFTEALQFKPDVVVIMLGTNDTKPQNWIFKDQFVRDYQDLILKFRGLETAPRIFLCRPAYVPGVGNFKITEPVILEELSVIERISRRERAGLIDIHGALVDRDALLPDRVHPNTDGANLMARTVYRALTGQSFEGEIPSFLRSDWKGYTKLTFASHGRAAQLVLPKASAPGNPWIWRTEFFGVEPQADLALLERGYHVAYLDVQNLYGGPAALEAMDQFYTEMRTDRKLSAKVVLEGFSRGGLFAFNWAALHPDRVAALYVDAPVCDFKSWPGGKGKGTGSPADWERCKKAYDLTEEQALVYPLNPIDNLKPLADAKIPILSVCGDADKTVPFDENTQVVEKRYKALGGEIKVIVKPGGDHHPHSLPDPAPIVDFILSHS
jgi:lysophospholipase L1-like esterase/pimeloyl-ACP methyl ester carboxylesterase